MLLKGIMSLSRTIVVENAGTAPITRHLFAMTGFEITSVLVVGTAPKRTLSFRPESQ
jgi:hypothetical protein